MKSRIVETMVEANPMLSAAEAARQHDAIVAAIVTLINAGESVRVQGVGTLKQRMRSARTGRNPRTGETLQIPARTVVAFTASKGA